MLFHRTFHAVGQGAFYSEEIRHDDGERLFRMVYDCGSDTLKGNKMLIKATDDLRSDTDVDLLIVSHFHRDHINGIPALNPKRVLIPYLSPDVAIYLMVQAQLEHTEFDLGMALHPEQVFPHAQIIRVWPDTDENNLNEEEEMKRREIEPSSSFLINVPDTPQAGVRDLNSNAEISVCSTYRAFPLWMYIPYNPNMEKLAKVFRKAVNDKHLVWDSLKDGDYFSKHFTEIKDIYTELGEKNRHSLVVYSGKVKNLYCSHIHSLSLPFFHICFNCDCTNCNIYRPLINDKPGCIYFGDITIGKWLNSFYDKLGDHLEHVSMMQVPHHGSHASKGDKIVAYKFQRDKYDRRKFFERGVCIISHGINNSHRHPSQTIINNLSRQGRIVLSVTECPSSEFHICYDLHYHH